MLLLKNIIMIKLVIFLLVVLAITTIFFIFKKPDISKINQEMLSPTIESEVSDSEDIKGLGYSGQNKLVSDSKGQIFTTYRKKINDQYSVFVSRLLYDNGYLKVDKSVNVSEEVEALPSQRVGSIGIDKEDGLHLVWYGEELEKNAGRQIKYAKSTDHGETWSEPVVVSFVEGFNKEDLWQEHPSVAVNDNGQVYVVWEGKDKDHTNQQIKFSKSVDGETWTGWKNVLPGSSSQSRPNILVANNGNLFVIAYSRNNLENQQIWLSRSKDQGKTWSDWQRVSSSATDARHADAVIDNDNIIHIAWRQGAESKKTQIYYSLFDGTKFLEPLAVSPDNTYQFFPQIGLGKNGQVYVTWFQTDKRSSYPDDDPETGVSYIAYKNPGEKNFSQKRLVSKNALYPSVLLDSILEDKTLVIFSKIKENSFPVSAKVMNLP